VSRVGELSGVALECRNPALLADFYSELTGWPVVYNDPDWCSVGQSEKASLHLSFQRAPSHEPSAGPDPASSMQIHLHFRVDDLDTAEGMTRRIGEDTRAVGRRLMAELRGASVQHGPLGRPCADPASARIVHEWCPLSPPGGDNASPAPPRPGICCPDGASMMTTFRRPSGCTAA
jgi:Glyoxalase-like domain